MGSMENVIWEAYRFLIRHLRVYCRETRLKVSRFQSHFT